MRAFALYLVLVALGLAPPTAAQSVALTGLAGQRLDLSAEAVAALPRAAIAFDVHGVAHVYEGPLLIDVLKVVGAPTGKDLRGPALAIVVLATARDGYQVAYSLAEADPGTRPNRIILADRADGAPLDAQTGPFQIVVEGDLRPARSIQQVTRLSLQSLGSGEAEDHAH